ncbi:MarR family transcriptional regulator [Streptomyces sp. NPDC014676]|uniref:MarR family transcriptional regulator n=1 Tax=Streptomyces sp. NPDC014676 TaxID=3364879 RepID=UPI0036FC4487
MSNLLGRARAIALHTASTGATTGEIARAAGVSASAASRHATALRDAGLVTTIRNGPTVLHTLTPTGASVLRAALRKADEESAGAPARAGGPGRARAVSPSCGWDTALGVGALGAVALSSAGA